MRILVVDDEVRLARHIMAALTQEGHDATVVYEGKRDWKRQSQVISN